MLSVSKIINHFRRYSPPNESSVALYNRLLLNLISRKNIALICRHHTAHQLLKCIMEDESTDVKWHFNKVISSVGAVIDNSTDIGSEENCMNLYLNCKFQTADLLEGVVVFNLL